MNKLRVGLIGGTGMVGQRFACLLKDHPWFEVTLIAASKKSAGLTYEEAVKDRWKMNEPIPEGVKNLIVKDAFDVDEISSMVDFVFCAISLNKEETRLLEEDYAKHEMPVISNNSANRYVQDVPVLIPEINNNHTEIIDIQKKRLGTKRGFISVKPNCSIQSYVPPISALLKYEPETILACTYQAISGAGKTFKECPEILDNVIPYIKGEEEKSENEPLKIWGKIENNKIVNASSPLITTQCIRVPVTDGHLAAVFVNFKTKPSKQEIIDAWENFKAPECALNLPSAPKKFLHYFDEPDRPQTKLDRDFENGMGITMGRLREDKLFQYKFVCLSHNTLRGAAGGGVLSAELLKTQGYLTSK
ncbi:aspartate-semialdehyde dehydrogenase [Clostridium acetobutylicum]|uniref:Aspartate-semialdehyde dehydrogenase n=1 Tax=Clostridium acetobutylicum (strain ATCC 824 / DSM 792 / JCM 1419 / IAM 19013 / LMG 5710 / NBRC 13948 / NRRL B-527 / VKM B-1787 / 2291 / W) TaxID=272562 RepID=Q97N16_CLOAB|nr:MULTISPECIES: aspartate-semialdehyde dehydrogenase [Clostridium]AAK78009.1 Aspartate-semialdehyde dehydrogenase [Clostridium acetobutylicum ATCC 824]ADZ19065.1 aspartate-semialdehyde dehydrogenase [Clostridium acetobutylicum EA 2018]AEI34529.1 aspartate-semialdehyde dehydrogenase [Clostridium acetobutylicum DSM 1731]AWV81928.1 aspartate-semialdehyde dehydrogenase [Clostridium acetobutylicum]MBC2395478.1 aspartate-semialdehyde dehydrogenase [Clostridium acetobutylicum]